MVSKDTLDELNSHIASITKYQDKDTSLIRRSEWGTITFDVVTKEVDHVLSMASSLAQMPLDSLTGTAVSDLLQSLPHVAQSLDRIDSFDVEQGNASATRDEIVIQVQDAVVNMHTQYAKWIPYLAFLRGDTDAMINKLKKAISTTQDKTAEVESYMRDKQDKVESYMRDKQDEVDNIVAAAREAAASAGVATFTHAFDKEAEKLTGTSSRWFWGTIGCSFVTLGVIVGLYLWSNPLAGADNWAIVRMMFMKVSAVAVLLNGSVWCARMYRATAHQATTNRHRALSLQTFQAFASATDDDRIRDAVLLAATKCIFANTSTGLVAESESVQDPSVQFMEIGSKSSER